MIRKRWYLMFIFFLGLFVLASFSYVEARELLKQATTETTRDGVPIGKIILYDDYEVEYDYGPHKLQGVSIKICKNRPCEETDDSPVVYPQQSFTDGQEAKFNISQYIVQEDKKVSYYISATGLFKSNDLTWWEEADLEYVVKLSGSDDVSDNMDEEDFKNSTEKVRYVVNTFVLPAIYILLGLVIIVKGILLAIDIVKYSDNPELRQQKLKATLYLFLALLLVALINTGIGIITGLFK